MATYVYSKEDFIKFIEKEVSNNQVIVFTNHLIGNLSVSKKSGIKIQHQYSDLVFKDEGIGHIYFNKSTSLGLIIADEERLSDAAKKILADTLEKQFNP